jgi:hypothetical protein
MNVTLTTRGGVAAPITMRRPPLVVTSDSPDLARLVAAATRACSGSPRRGGDAMSYTITIEDGADSTVLSATDADMPPAFADLVDWLQAF